MNENKKNNYIIGHSSRPVMSCQVKSRPSLFETLAAVKKQVDFDDFGTVVKATGRKIFDPLHEEICLIVAEVLVRPPDTVMRINGREIEVGIVQEVYSMLTYDHIQMVYKNFRAQESHVYKKSAYLQTSLYNAVFELNANDTNGDC